MLNIKKEGKAPGGAYYKLIKLPDKRSQTSKKKELLFLNKRRGAGYSGYSMKDRLKILESSLDMWS